MRARFALVLALAALGCSSSTEGTAANPSPHPCATKLGGAWKVVDVLSASTGDCSGPPRIEASVSVDNAITSWHEIHDGIVFDYHVEVSGLRSGCENELVVASRTADSGDGSQAISRELSLTREGTLMGRTKVMNFAHKDDASPSCLLVYDTDGAR